MFKKKQAIRIAVNDVLDGKVELTVQYGKAIYSFTIPENHEVWIDDDGVWQQSEAGWAKAFRSLINRSFVPKKEIDQ